MALDLVIVDNLCCVRRLFKDNMIVCLNTVKLLRILAILKTVLIVNVIIPADIDISFFPQTEHVG